MVAEASAVVKRKGSPAKMNAKRAKVATVAPPPGADLSPLTAANAAGRRVLVLRSIWPDYACNENDAAGWSALVVRAGKAWCDVAFLDARDADGHLYKNERLSYDVLRPL